MTKLALAKRIASIVVYGHILLFAFGLIVMLIGPYDKEDTAQMLLMGSPLLAMVALSAYRFMSTLPQKDSSDVEDKDWVRMCTITTFMFILSLFAVYFVAAINTHIPVTTLKFIVGGIETVLGAYLGVNRDTLFPEVGK